MASAILVALLAGIATLLLQMDRLEEKVRKISAEHGSGKIALFLKRYRDACDRQHTFEPSLDLNGTGFIAITVFDARMQPVFTKTTADYPRIEKEIGQIDHHVAYSEDGSTIRFIHNHIENRFYVRILTAATLPGGRHGYIEVLYRVGDAELRGIYTDIALNVLLAIGAVAVLFAMLYPGILFLNRRLIERTAELSDANVQIMAVLGDAIAKRDNETNAHNYRVTLYSLALGEDLGLDDTQMQGLLKGAFLHDVGKIGIPDAILRKPGKLDRREFAVMKQHVRYGQEIIERSSWLADARQVIASHHEHYDGSGYLEGLQGDAIPLLARIFALADVFDALTSARPYKEAYSYEKSIKMIADKKGSHFDPALAERFIGIIEPYYRRIGGKEDERWLRQELTRYTDRYL